MPRRARSYDKHVPQPDPKFASVKYAKFINYLMERGKKSVAQKIFYTAIGIVEEKITTDTTANNAASVSGEAKKMDGRQVFDIALKNVAPIMEIKGRRIGGSNYQVPM